MDAGDGGWSLCVVLVSGWPRASGSTTDSRHEDEPVDYEDQVREVVMIVGDYAQPAMFQNSLGAQLPEEYEGLRD